MIKCKIKINQPQSYAFSFHCARSNSLEVEVNNFSQRYLRLDILIETLNKLFPCIPSDAQGIQRMVLLLCPLARKLSRQLVQSNSSPLYQPRMGPTTIKFSSSGGGGGHTDESNAWGVPGDVSI